MTDTDLLVYAQAYLLFAKTQHRFLLDAYALARSEGRTGEEYVIPIRKAAEEVQHALTQMKTALDRFQSTQKMLAEMVAERKRQIDEEYVRIEKERQEKKR